MTLLFTNDLRLLTLLLSRFDSYHYSRDWDRRHIPRQIDSRPRHPCLTRVGTRYPASALSFG